MIKIIKKLFLLGLLSTSIAFSTTVSAYADETVEMLNKLNKEFMVYSKKIVKIKTGETVFWKSTNAGHNVEFIKGGFPDGVEKFKSKMNKDTQFKFEIPGIYAYWCTPHKGMGMIGFVIVGDDKSNLENIKTIKYSGKSKKIATELISQL
tara:strand:+ start:88 stop:537 length:450 start_codon:yes stop_codon:yes gene_type:complete